MTADTNAPNPKNTVFSPKYTVSPTPSRFIWNSRPMRGLMRFSVSALTMDWNAPPIMTPMARSITLPLRAKALNSLKKPFMEPFSDFSASFRCRPAFFSC